MWRCFSTFYKVTLEFKPMTEKEKLKRDEVLKLLDIPEDTLSTYEKELEINSSYPNDDPLENFTSEDVDSIRVFHRLLESGMSKNEVRILASFSEILRNVDIDGSDGIKNLLALSPIYRLKQTLGVARQELELLRQKSSELEEKLIKEIEFRAQVDKTNCSLSAEVEAKQKTLESLDKKLSETLLQKAHLESQLSVHAESKLSSSQISQSAQLKGKKSKELYEVIVQKDSEISELKSAIDKLKEEIKKKEEEAEELSERLEFVQDDMAEMENEVEERYQEQIKSIRENVEGLIDTKQKEWDAFFLKISEQQKTEILTLQRKHEEEVKMLKDKISDQLVEINQLKMSKNPIVGMFKKKN